MNSNRIISGLLVASLLVGCATASKEISATYVSPVQYQSYDCQQLSIESQRLLSRVSQLGGRLDEASSNDKAITGVGLILFWPALFALGGTKHQEAEYARLKGEYDAVNQAVIERKCSGNYQQASGALPVKNESQKTVVSPELKTDATAQMTTKDVGPTASTASRLEALNELKTKDLISTETYELKRKEILSEM